MRYCPKCNARFDESNSFCLNDGSTLYDYDDEQVTNFSPNRQINIENNSQSSKNLLKYSIFSIFGFLVIAGLAVIVILSLNRQAISDSSFDPQNSSDNIKLKEKELELKEKELALKQKEMDNQTVEVQGKPLPPVNPNNPNSYSGNISNDNATFNLSWNKNNTVTGSFYYNYSPNTGYTVSGTNFRKGEAEIKVYNGTQVAGTMKIYKNIGGGKICWSGSFYQSSGATVPVGFCRYR